jgi:hypothetical protein
MKQWGCLKMAFVLLLIAGFSFNAECAKRKKLNVTVLDRETSAVIQNAVVTVIILSNGTETETETKDTGKDGQCKFMLQVDSSYQYKVFAEKSGYFKCIPEAGKNNLVSEVLISGDNDQVLILYLTLESQVPEKKTSKPAAKPVTDDNTAKSAKSDKVVTESKKPVKSTVAEEKEQPKPKPVEQNVTEIKPPVTDTIAETPPTQQNPQDGESKGGLFWILSIIIFIIIIIFLWMMKKRYDKKMRQKRDNEN